MYKNNKNIININLIMLAVYGLSYLLYLVHFPYLIYLTGIVFFFLTGFNLTLMMEQITNVKLGQAKTILWTILFSLFVPATLVYVASLVFSQFGDIKITMLTFFALYLFSILGVVVLSLFNKSFPTNFNFQKIRLHPVLVAALITFLVVIGINMILYPFIPEADSYTYLIRLREIFTTHQMPQNELRPLFPALTWTMVYVTKMSGYWLYKLIFPILCGCLVLVSYLTASRFTKNKKALYIGSILSLTFPIIVMEFLITRPQSVFLITLPIILFLLGDIVKDKKNEGILQIALIGLFSLIGIKIHDFFLFDLVLCIVATIIFFWKTIVKRPLFSLSLVFGFLVLLFPWLQNLGFLPMLQNFSKVIGVYVTHLQFNPWFIDNYTNVDGNQMGWPCWTSLIYYGYNLGIFFWLLIVLILAKKQKLSIKGISWTFTFCFAFFFFIAEIFPRFGLAYLPDRAWLFVSICLAILLIPMSAKFIEGSNKKIINLVLVVIFASIGVSFAVTYAKQGWISRNEYKSAIYLKENTPNNSFIVTQGGNVPLVEYFSERELIVPQSEFFTDNLLHADTDSLLANTFTSLESINREEIVLRERIEKRTGLLFSDYFASYNPATNAADMNQYFKLKQDQRKALAHVESVKNNNKYILFSKDKFDNLYGTRAWWKDFNFYSAKLEKFDNNSNFEKIYNEDGVSIWRMHE